MEAIVVHGERAKNSSRSTNFLALVVVEDGEQFVALIRPPHANRFPQNVQINPSISPARLKRQTLMNQNDSTRLIDPRQVLQTFLQCIPVPSEVAGKV